MRLRTRSAGTGVVALISRLRRWTRFLRGSYALSARTRSGFLPFRRPGRVLVGPADGGVDVHVPDVQALRVCLGLEPGDDPGPDAVPVPASEQVIHPVPGPVAFRHIAPGSTGPGPPPHASISCRRVRTGGRPGLMPCGSNGSRRAHWPSVRSLRSTVRDHPRPRSTPRRTPPRNHSPRLPAHPVPAAAESVQPHQENGRPRTSDEETHKVHTGQPSGRPDQGPR